METFSALLALCARNSPVTGEFPEQRPVTPCFDVFFDLRLNKRLSKQSWGWWFETPSRSLWRHCNGELYIGIRKWHGYWWWQVNLTPTHGRFYLPSDRSPQFYVGPCFEQNLGVWVSSIFMRCHASDDLLFFVNLGCCLAGFSFVHGLEMSIVELLRVI